MFRPAAPVIRSGPRRGRPPRSPRCRPYLPRTICLRRFSAAAVTAICVPPNPPPLWRSLGAAFRAVVSGLRQSIIARAAVKGEFRIEQTMIRNRGNNPIKFSADDDDALAALLGAGRHSDMEPIEAIDEAMRDIRLHELATVAAMQAAVRALLAEFEPSKLRRSAEHGGLALLPAQRKANAWDAFEARHARVSRGAARRFR